jgi:hypothetical protein
MTGHVQKLVYAVCLYFDWKSPYALNHCRIWSKRCIFFVFKNKTLWRMSNVNEAVCGPPERQIRTSSCLCAEVCSEVITWNNNNVHKQGLSTGISCIFFPWKSRTIQIWEPYLATVVQCCNPLLPFVTNINYNCKPTSMWRLKGKL